MSSIIKVDTIQNQSGANIISESSNTITVGASGDTITVPSGATLGGAGTVDLSSATVTLNASMKNTPAFYAYKSSGQSVDSDTNTKVTFDTELFDSDGKYDTGASRFTPTVAGYYLVSSTVSFTNHPASAYCQIRIVKNGVTQFTEFNQNQFASSDADTKTTATFMIYLDSNDYLEIFIRQNAGQSETTRTGQEVRFMAQKIIGA